MDNDIDAITPGNSSTLTTSTSSSSAAVPTTLLAAKPRYVRLVSTGNVFVKSFSATQATATATARVKTIATNSGTNGTGYTNGDVVTLVGGTGTAATFTLTVAGGNVTGIALTTAGNYTVVPTTITAAAVTGGTGTTLKVDAVFEVGTITTGEAGTSYATAPTVAIGGAGGSGTNITVAVSGGSLGAYTYTGRGTGFTSTLTVTIGPPNTAATTDDILVTSAPIILNVSGAAFLSAIADSGTPKLSVLAVDF